MARPEFSSLIKLIFVITIVTAANPAKADGLLEGMADGVNEAADYLIKAADTAAQNLKTATAPSAKAFADNVHQVAAQLADLLSDAADRVRQNAGGSGE